MRRINVILSIAALAALASPAAAQDGGKYGRNDGRIYDKNGDGRIDSRDRQQSNCAWYDTNCNGINTTRRNGSNSTGWQLIGRDLDGNAIYERRIYERNGKTTVETARQTQDGRMRIIDKRKLDTRYDRNNRIYGRDRDERDDRNDRDRDGIDDRYERGRGR